MNKLFKHLLDIATANPKANAIVTNQGKINYEDFVVLIYQIAANFELILKDAQNKCVILATEKSIDAYAAQFATLISGGFYVPLDLSLPKSTNELIIKKINPSIIYTNSNSLNFKFKNTIYSSGLSKRRFSETNSLHNLAYVKFTSGSTGKPKGVKISQDSMNNYVEWVIKTFGASVGDRWSQHANLSFDISITDIFGCLTTGGTLFPISRLSELLLPAEHIRKNKITIWGSVPSVIDMMSKVKLINSENLSSIRLFNFCGEELFRSQVEELFDAVPKAKIQNLYGPTEATVACKAITLDKKSFADYMFNSIELGLDLPNVNTIIEDDELLVSGIQLSEGYWEENELTAKSFKTKKINNEDTRVYYTGDLVKTTEDDKVLFQGRKDQQIKLRGHRIELGEVTEAIKKCGYREATVVFHSNSIVAFIRADKIDPDALASKLLNFLPKVSIPSRFIVLDDFPRTKNLKLDTNTLIATYLAKLR